MKPTNQKLKPYTKKWLSIEDQLKLMEERGIQLGNYSKEKALNKLEFIGYYRLSGYAYTFKKSPTNDYFETNTHFEDIINLYKFDRKLKIIVMDAIERIEIALRSTLSYKLGSIDPFILEHDSRYQSIRSRIDDAIETNKEDFNKHFKETYKRPYPVWMLINLLDFGALVQIYNQSEPKQKLEIAKKFGVHSSAYFSSWLQTIRFIRNKCAHHARLWNTHMVRIPKVAKNSKDYPWIKDFDFSKHPELKLWYSLKIVEHMLTTLKASTNWVKRLEEVMKEFPELKSKKKVGKEDMRYCS